MVVSVAIVGCGAIARRVHAPVFKSLSNVNLCSVADSDEHLAIALAREQQIAKYSTSFDQVLNDEDVQAVSLCTPSFTHSEMIIRAAKAGKHILVEKPLALDVASAEAALRAVKENNVKLCVVFNFRMFPASQEMRRIIISGQLGRIVSMIGVCHGSFPVSWTRSAWLYHYGGALDDAAPHLVDLMLWLNPSRLESVAASGGDFTGNFDFISHAQVAMRFKDTSIATADISWLNDLFVSSVDVYGTSGRLAEDVRNNSFTETHGQVQSPLSEFGSVTKKSSRIVRSMISGEYFRGGLKYHKAILEGFVNSIVDKTEPPITGQEALMQTVVSDAAKVSLKSGKTVYVKDLLNQ